MNTIEQLESALAAATQGEWEATFNETGGYDAMTACVRVSSAEQDIADFDLADYGQETCQEYTAEQRGSAEANARLICQLKNNAPALIECAKALKAMTFTYRTFSDQVPQDEQQWTSIDEGILAEAEAALAKLEKAK